MSNTEEYDLTTIIKINFLILIASRVSNKLSTSYIECFTTIAQFLDLSYTIS